MFAKDRASVDAFVSVKVTVQGNAGPLVAAVKSDVVNKVHTTWNMIHAVRREDFLHAFQGYLV